MAGIYDYDVSHRKAGMVMIKPTIEQLQLRIADMEDALQWIQKIADINYEQDTKLRTQGARTLMRISERALSSLKNGDTSHD